MVSSFRYLFFLQEVGVKEGWRAALEAENCRPARWKQSALWIGTYSRLSPRRLRRLELTHSSEQERIKFISTLVPEGCYVPGGHKINIDLIECCPLVSSFPFFPPDPPVASLDPWKLRIDEILRQVKENLNINTFSLPFGLLSPLYCALCIPMDGNTGSTTNSNILPAFKMTPEVISFLFNFARDYNDP